MPPGRRLIDLVDMLVCYDSGVGVLAARHGTLVIAVGNAFCNLEGVGTSHSPTYGLFLSQNERRRLLETPRDFFAKARRPLSRSGRRMFARQARRPPLSGHVRR